MAKRAIKNKGNAKNDTKIIHSAEELHIEALVVVDYTMVSYHKEFNIENYVLTVFNMVRSMYSYLM